MVNLRSDLAEALEEALSGVGQKNMRVSTRDLITKYREGVEATERVLHSPLDAAAYAAYRMPATYAAARGAFRRIAELAPGFAPKTHIDVGGGTGSAVWAASEAWPTLRSATVLEQSPPAVALGERLARESESATVRGCDWRRVRVEGEISGPPADLVTVSYVLGELAAEAREGVVASLARRATMLVLIEPGTPAGYVRVLAARSLLTGMGHHLVAPCPHAGECPIEQGADWCHFSARLNRTALQRRLKVGTLGFEDEKYTYLATSPQPWSRAGNRILRHPQQRKGVVSLRLCTRHDGLRTVLVSKRDGDTYRMARKASWGDAWPPSR